MVKILDFVQALQDGKAAELADLFSMNAVLHDSSMLKLREEPMHLEGKFAIEMMFHHKFGFNGGGYKIRAIKCRDENRSWYFIFYGGIVVNVTAQIEERDEEGKIKRLNIYPL
ncbi:MAG: hypothetical protein SO135_04145 [Sphaerochaetaceae bacterium]|jgi:hypothetical protein|nr:hypothetical protein [Sphaerochaetaceae bacterium]NLY07846.1 hypothetical protein [Spirochaetales bacterium]